MSITKVDQGLDWKRKLQVKQTMSKYDEMMMRTKSKAEQMNLFTDDRSLFEKLCSLEYLREGFKAVKKNRGSPGIDGVTIEKFNARLDEELAQLKKELEGWTLGSINGLKLHEEPYTHPYVRFCGQTEAFYSLL